MSLNNRVLVLVCTTLASIALFGSAANAASTLSIHYFDIKNPGGNFNPPYPSTDFGICCSSGPATGEGDLTGTSLLGGLPVEGAGGNIVNVSGLGQILWWTPGTVDPATGFKIQATGSGIVTLPFNPTFSDNMFAPNGTGSGNSGLYETAFLSGNITETGGPASLSLNADDDALIYLNGQYIGGIPGVHHNLGSAITIGLPTFSGTEKLEVFYADRANVEANLSLGVFGAVTSGVPEPATWAMLLLGFFGVGFMVRGARRKDAVAIA